MWDRWAKFPTTRRDLDAFQSVIEMKITTVNFVILLAAVNLSAAAASGSNYGSEVNQYNDAYETYEEGSYNEESQHVSVEEDDTFREYIVHEERFCHANNFHSVGNFISQFSLDKQTYEIMD